MGWTEWHRTKWPRAVDTRGIGRGTCSLAVLVFLMLFVSCTVRVSVPAFFGTVQECMAAEEYETVLDILEGEKIHVHQKVDWYYYDYGVALYKAYPRKVRYSISLLETANVFSPDDGAILYHLGKYFSEIGEYDKAIERFSASQDKVHKDYLCFSEKTDSEFWLIVLNGRIGNSALSEELLRSSTKEGRGIECLRRIRAGTATLKDVCVDDELSLEERLWCIDFYFNTPAKYENLAAYAQACESVLPYCDKETANYINANLMYFYLALGKIEEVEGLLQNYGRYPLYLIDSEESMVNERFYQYLSFYYWKTGDAIMANNSLEIFKRCYFKPVEYTWRGSERLENIPDFFGWTLDFQNIQ